MRRIVFPQVTEASAIDISSLLGNFGIAEVGELGDTIADVIRNLIKERNALRDRVSQLDKAISSLRKEYYSTVKSLNDCKAALDRRTREWEGARKLYQSCTSELDKVARERNALKAEVDRLRKMENVDVYKKKVSELSARVAQAEGILNEIRSILHSAGLI